MNAYLLDNRRLPCDRPAYYSPGDESEAIICADAINPAWKRHRRAVQWLKQHRQDRD